MNTLLILMADMTDDVEVTVRPFDGRWEAVVTSYGIATEVGQRQFRAVGTSPIEATTRALMDARKN